MKKKSVVIISLLLCILCSIGAWAETLQGRVVGVSDGDTFTLLVDGNKQVKVRLHGIDAPEKSGNQPFSQKSKEKLSELIAGKTVSVEVNDYDRYGRALGIVKTDTHSDVNLEMIECGMAWHYNYYDKTPAYIQAQKNAKAKRLGLWADKNPVNPYEWRKQKKNNKKQR